MKGKRGMGVAKAVLIAANIVLAALLIHLALNG